MWAILKTALQLDIYDINQSFGRIDPQRLSISGIGRSGVLIRIASFLVHMLRSFRLHHGMHPALKLEAATQPPVIFLFVTVNQKNSLQQIVVKMPGALFVGVDITGSLNLDGAIPFPVFYVYLASLPFLPLVLAKWLAAKGHRKLSFRRGFDSYWLVYGSYLAARWWFRRFHLGGLVIANDNSPVTRGFARAARDENMPVFYIQHASASLKFPPLSFDYAFLDGMDSLHKYQRIGPVNSRVFLVGVAKGDHFYHLKNQHVQVTRVGICANMLDPLERVDELCRFLRQRFPMLELILRPHPGDHRPKEWPKLADRYAIGFSDARQENPFEFLSKVDAIIAGSSNIQLEAALMNVVPLSYDFSQQGKNQYGFDQYGFMEHGLVDYCSNLEELEIYLDKFIQAKPDVSSRARYYCATAGTPFEGKSGLLVVGLLNSIMRCGEPDLNGWHRLPFDGQEVYEPIEIEHNGGGV